MTSSAIPRTDATVDHLLDRHLVWLAMTTGARRGELCALRWRDLDRAVLRIRTSIAQASGRCWEKSTKTHQQRRIALDPETVAILRDLRARCDQRATALDVPVPRDAFLFSLSPDNADHLQPDSVSQRYRKMVRRLGSTRIAPDRVVTVDGYAGGGQPLLRDQLARTHRVACPFVHVVLRRGRRG